MTNHTTYLKIKISSLAAKARQLLIETRVQRRLGRPARLIASRERPWRGPRGWSAPRPASSRGGPPARPGSTVDPHRPDPGLLQPTANDDR